MQNLSPRAIRLYLMRLDDLLGFAVPGQLAARTRPHSQFVFLWSRVCYALLSASPRCLRLALRYGCRHRPRLAPFIQLDSAHAGHTRRGTPSSRCPKRDEGPMRQPHEMLRDRTRLNQAHTQLSLFRLAVTFRAPPASNNRVSTRRDWILVSNPHVTIKDPNIFRFLCV